MSGMKGWIYDPCLPLGFTSGKEFADYLRRCSADDLGAMGLRLSQDIGILKWRLSQVRKVQVEKKSR
jgi:hypothetical protein